jgi:DNA-binding GntR family transcriptional regulator
MKNGASDLAELVYFSLKNRILRGEIEAGEPLLEEQLSALFKVSRTPLRKALTALKAEGYLIKGKDRTLRVPKLTAKDADDVLAARRLLETAAAREAAKNAVPEETERLYHLVLDEEEALKNRDTVLTAALDRMFHNQIARMSENGVYEELIGKIEYKISLCLALSNTLGEDINDALTEHRAIAAAIEAGEPECAAQAMTEHLDNVRRRMNAGIEKQADSPKRRATTP